MRITDDCMSCGMCYDVCANSAIYVGISKGGYAKYEIDTDECLECGLCIDECPANAIVED